ncbi:hypothetical protein SDC9_100361 [bioreactor metagenome]|uniref:Uncharacterized protein n=1 Tax=bioreactor metagenome TaxID=1076179 RepID=A0A645ARV0_9ZZZZ
MFSVAHLDFEPLRQSVDHRGAHAVQAPRDLIPLPAELSAGVQNSKYHLNGRYSHLRLDAHRDAPPVVGHPYDVTFQNGHLDMGAVSGQGLVDGVVHDLIDQVVQPAQGC